MNENDINIYNFIALYDSLLLNLSNKNRQFKIYLYYLDNKFNIEIKDSEKQEVILKYNFSCEEKEYFKLISLIGNEFIDNHTITLPMFKNISLNDSKLYYKSNDSLNNALNYDNAKIHVLRNSIFELRIYYFNGLNSLSYEMQDKAMMKLNQKKKKFIK